LPPLHDSLEGSGLPVEASSGGRTKYNRARLGIARTHALDAACVGEVGTLVGWQIPLMEIKAAEEAITAARFPTRLLHAHHVRSRLSRPAT
jgi:hypothetical protein